VLHLHNLAAVPRDSGESLLERAKYVRKEQATFNQTLCEQALV
jgi:hypothetical protein